jgi:peroxiredoxin (alkyl hydroperoxide reductase subunit C)
MYPEFQKLGVEVYSVSTDTHFTHKAWADASDTIKKINYPMIGDPTGAITRNFDVMIEEAGLALRGTFVVNPEGQIKVAEIHDLGIGRDASELLRKVKAAQYVASHPGEVCPAKWTEGAETLKPSLDLVGKIRLPDCPVFKTPGRPLALGRFYIQNRERRKSSCWMPPSRPSCKPI